MSAQPDSPRVDADAERRKRRLERFGPTEPSRDRSGRNNRSKKNQQHKKDSRPRGTEGRNEEEEQKYNGNDNSNSHITRKLSVFPTEPEKSSGSSASTSASVQNANSNVTSEEIFPASKHSHFNLVPGHCNTTTKEPMPRPPDMRLVTALASKGGTLGTCLKNMNMGPSEKETPLQQLTTRDVLMIPDLFEESSGFIMPEDPFLDIKSSGPHRKKTIYQRLVEEIHHAGKVSSGRRAGNAQHDTAFSTDKDGK